MGISQNELDKMRYFIHIQMDVFILMDLLNQNDFFGLMITIWRQILIIRNDKPNMTEYDPIVG